MTPVWAVVSGKGGVGKSIIAVSLAVGLASRGHRVVLMDMDTGLRNLDLMLGLENRVLFDLVDVMDEHATLEQALVVDKQRPNLSLLSTSQIAVPSAIAATFFKRLVNMLRTRFAYVIIDCPSGVGHTFTLCMDVITDAIVVTTSDDIAIRDADRVVGMIRSRGAERPGEEGPTRLHLIINRIRPDWVARRMQYPPEVVARTIDAPLAGALLEDDEVPRCLIARRPIIEGDGKTWETMDAILRRLMGENIPLPSMMGERRLFGKRRRQ
ncbi:MAG: septum site-determining protein MinD [Oscillospiraceae bacterium]|jgi:septum site-determining protein MinD|nr:septum site-determining protein MinD [Oscillospiraceae bacterium]